MTKKTKNFEKIEKLIGDFLNRTIDAEAVLKNWPNLEQVMTKREGYLVHSLQHFKTDSDIHIKDPEYEVNERIAIKDAFEDLD